MSLWKQEKNSLAGPLGVAASATTPIPVLTITTFSAMAVSVGYVGSSPRKGRAEKCRSSRRCSGSARSANYRHYNSAYRIVLEHPKKLTQERVAGLARLIAEFRNQ